MNYFFLFLAFIMPSSSTLYRQIVRILCLFGLGLSSYAFYVETKKGQDPSYRAACDLAERMSCSRVLTSRWARGFGLFDANSPFNLPDSLYGFLYYCLVLLLNQSNQSKSIARLRVFLAILTNCGSIYLGYILYFILKDFCLVCCGMYVVNFLLLICNFKLLALTNHHRNTTSATNSQSKGKQKKH